MEHIIIKKTTIDELEQLQSISVQTFSEAFAAGNTAENLNKYLDEAFSIQKLRTELDNPGSEFYFAMLQGKPVGYLKLNFGRAQTEHLDLNALEIERIYVLQEFLGQKLGQLLYGQALQCAVQRNAAYIWLGVWEENPRAIRFYKKNGFVPFDKHLFKVGDDLQTDIMMKRELSLDEL